MALSDDLNTIPGLVGDAFEQVGKLVQNETQLAKAEISEKLTQVGVGAAFLAGAAILAIPVLVIVMIALALWLGATLQLSPPVAYLSAAAIGAIFCLILALFGSSYLKPDNIKPKVTLRQVERDVTAAKEMVR